MRVVWLSADARVCFEVRYFDRLAGLLHLNLMGMSIWPYPSLRAIEALFRLDGR